MSTEEILKEVKSWLEEDGKDLELLRSRLDKNMENTISTTGNAAKVDESVVVECNLDWPNEWKDEEFKKVKVDITF